MILMLGLKELLKMLQGRCHVHVIIAVSMKLDAANENESSLASKFMS